MSSNRHFLVIGPDGNAGGVGGVKTHIEILQCVLRTYAKKMKVTYGAPVLEMFKERLFFNPDVVIYNLSVYRNKIIRDMITRTIMSSLRTKNILHLHGGNFANVSWANNAVWKALLKIHLRRFDQIYCLTNAQFSAVSEYVGKTDNVRKILNYVNIPDMNTLNNTDDTLNLLYIGRLHPLKGIKEAIEAVSQIQDNRIRFWIMGSGELENELRNVGDPRIVFLGPKVGKDKEEYLLRSHVLLLPSWAESLPYALLEAASYGLALVSTPVGAVNEVLEENTNGFFVQPGDVSALRQSIERFINDPTLAARMGKESRRICEKRFSIGALAKIYDELFERLEKGSHLKYEI
jgi:glycosyltransferase involved in cell wall biosynthesis